MGHIVDLMVDGLNARLAAKELTCVLTPAAKEFVIDNAYDPLYGARPLRRYLQHTVETLISKAIIAGNVSSGQTLTLDVQGGELTLSGKEVLRGDVVN